MKIERIIGGGLEANGYISYLAEGSEAWILDPGYEPNRYLDFTEANGLRVQGILLTHHHHDHMGAAESLRRTLKCPLFLHQREISYYPEPWDVGLAGGETLALGDDQLQVCFTPGHTAGGVCFYSEKSRLAFTGDTIFNVDLGRTDMPGGSADQMRDSLVRVVSHWRDDVTIYPGHGDPCDMAFVRRVNREYLEMMQ